MSKRFYACLLVVSLLISLMPFQGLADADQIALEPIKEFTFPDPAAEMPVFTIQNLNSYDVEVSVKIHDLSNNSLVQSLNYVLYQGDAPLVVFARVYKPLYDNGEVNAYRYTISTQNGFKERLNYAQKLSVRTDSSGNPHYTYDQYTNSYYPRNTICSMGPRFRDLTPGVTKQWYMFTPIDLSLQGRQTFPLIGGNMYLVGEAYVDVTGDQVMVSYHYFHSNEDGYMNSAIEDYLMFYRSYGDVMFPEPQRYNSPFRFNRAFSISGDLGGDSNVLMFIRNRLSFNRFSAPKSELVRYRDDLPENVSRIAEMIRMMDPIP